MTQNPAGDYSFDYAGLLERPGDPITLTVGGAAVIERVMATVATLELPVIDVARAFSSQPDPLTLFQYPGSHYNARGYRVAAEAVRDGLAR